MNVATRKGESDLSLDHRAGLKLMQCVPCKQRGHYCEADTVIDGEAWCNACADGEPCRHELIEARRRDGGRSPMLAGDTLRGVKVKNHRPRELFCKREGCTRKITATNVSGFCSDHDRREESQVTAIEMEAAEPEQLKERSEMKLTAEERAERKKCSKCGKTLRRDAKADICSPCRRTPVGVYPSRTRKSVATPAQERPASSPQNGCHTTDLPLGVATICVTEANLDSFWQRLSLDEKVRLFQLQLEG